MLCIYRQNGHVLRNTGYLQLTTQGLAMCARPALMGLRRRARIILPHACEIPPVGYELTCGG